jgi:hypothetical protein
MICEKTVFPEFIIHTSNKIEVGITGMKFQIDKKKNNAYLSVIIDLSMKQIYINRTLLMRDN